MYPSIEPFNSGYLDVGNKHSIYWEECGNPNGTPIMFLHGGPGAGCFPVHRRFFDPNHWRIILFDQRGCGRSTPTGSIQANTTQYIISDIEMIRKDLDIDKFVIFGGSWGSLLALAYGVQYPDKCIGFILRGIFLGTTEELRWFLFEMGRFFPDAHKDFLSVLPEIEQKDLLPNFYKRLLNPDPKVHLNAAQAWSSYESSCSRLVPPPGQSIATSLPLARIECHYFINNMFLTDTYITDRLNYIEHLPCILIQGRYDIICPPWTAQNLASIWKKSKLKLIENAGHSAFEPGINLALLEATEEMKKWS